MNLQLLGRHRIPWVLQDRRNARRNNHMYVIVSRLTFRPVIGYTVDLQQIQFDLQQIYQTDAQQIHCRTNVDHGYLTFGKICWLTRYWHSQIQLNLDNWHSAVAEKPFKLSNRDNYEKLIICKHGTTVAEKSCQLSNRANYKGANYRGSTVPDRSIFIFPHLFGSGFKKISSISVINL